MVLGGPVHLSGGALSTENKHKMRESSLTSCTLWQVPDVNENFQSQNIEVRVYLLKAFQMTPVQVDPTP